MLVLMGIFFMRWNVVIGGQLFSKSFLGFTSFKLGLIGAEGFLMALFLAHSAFCNSCFFALVAATMEKT